MGKPVQKPRTYLLLRDVKRFINVLDYKDGKHNNQLLKYQHYNIFESLEDALHFCCSKLANLHFKKKCIFAMDLPADELENLIARGGQDFSLHIIEIFDTFGYSCEENIDPSNFPDEDGRTQVGTPRLG